MFLFIISAVILLGLIIVLIYNSIIYRKNQVDNAFAGIDAMLKKRYDLIPALADTVKAYMNYERELIEKITHLRTSYLSEEQQLNKVKCSDEITQQMKNLFVTLENYPQLKANENFLKLQAAWNEMEDQVAAARRFYNSSVNDYHNALEMFPSNIIARMMRLKPRVYFSAGEEEKLPPST